MRLRRVRPPDALRTPSILRRPPVRRRLGLSALWTCCTVLTTAAGLTAVHLVGDEVSDRGTSAMSQDAVSRAVAQLPGAAPSRAVPDPPPELFGQPTPGASPSGSAGRHHGAPSASASAAPGDAHATTPASRTAAPQQTPRQPPASPAPTRPPATGKPAPTPTPGSTGIVHVTGGTVYLRCDAERVYVRAAYPEDGYHVRPVHGDKNRRWVFVEFDHDGHRDAWQVWASCEGGELHAVSRNVSHGKPTPSPSPSPTPSRMPSPSPTVPSPHAAVASPAAAAATAAE